MNTIHHQEVLHCLFRESNDAFFLFDPVSLLVLDLNPAALRLTGLDRKAALRLRVTELFSSDDPDGVANLIEAYRKTGIFHSREDYFLARPGGEPIAVNLSASRIHTQPEPIGLVVARDISERRRAQEVLERFFRSSPALFGILTDDGRFRVANGAWNDTLGYSMEELRSAEVLSLVPPEDREVARRAIEPRRGGPSPVEVRFRHKSGGDRWLSWSSARADGNNYAVALDVTATKEADGLRLAKETAEAASRAKGQFLSRMSHELRTPLTAILTLVDVLIGDPSLRGIAKDRADDLATIRRNGDYLLQLINSVLDLAKIEGGQFATAPVPCDPKGIVDEVIGLMKARATAKGLPLEAAYATPTPVFLADPVHLRQILINLVGNAIKFTEEGGVRVEVGMEDGPTLRVEVIDTGIGMVDGELSSLFQPFRQAGDARRLNPGGTGLGLAISQRLAMAMGGSITVRSERGVGSTFRLAIPAGEPARMPFGDRPAEEPSSPPAQPASESGSPRSRRVLLAEDNSDNRRAIRTRLEQLGLDVSTAQNGQEALDVALGSIAHGRAFDLILMDMQMPVLDGYEATRQLRVRGYEGPIVALTAFALDEDREECLRFGCDDHISKPIDWSHLSGLIDRLP